MTVERTLRMQVTTQLTGSDKQIAWANNIRKITMDVLTAEIGQKIEGSKHANAIQAVLNAKTDARWWIDNATGDQSMIHFPHLFKLIGPEVNAFIAK